MNLLLVDDSKAIRMLVKRILRGLGIKGSSITEAEDGALALESIKASKPDLVLCDWNMPNMNGMELLTAIKEEGIDLIFGFVTTEGTSEMRTKAEEAGAQFLITKPFTPASFESEIGKYL